MKGRPIPYSQAELAWIKSHATDDRREMHARFCRHFQRDDVSLKALNALCKRKGWLTGRTGRYEKGAVPANKGKKMPYHPNSARTQFKAGNKPHNTKYLGHERISNDGYVEISIDEVNPHTGFERRYVLKHRYLWEQANGPVPEGMALKCLDGNRQNCDPSNWEAIPRSMMPYLNGHRGINYDTAAPEVRPAVLLIAKVKNARRQAQKKAVQHG